jgi:hypothetical protein
MRKIFKRHIVHFSVAVVLLLSLTFVPVISSFAVNKCMSGPDKKSCCCCSNSEESKCGKEQVKKSCPMCNESMKESSETLPAVFNPQKISGLFLIDFYQYITSCNNCILSISKTRNILLSDFKIFLEISSLRI